MDIPEIIHVHWLSTVYVTSVVSVEIYKLSMIFTMRRECRAYYFIAESLFRQYRKWNDFFETE